MKKRELCRAVLTVTVIGLMLTAGVSIYISGVLDPSAQMQSGGIDQPGDVIGTLAPGSQTGPGAEDAGEIIGDGVVIINSSSGSYDDFLRKLEALDASLSSMREDSADTSALALKSREEAEKSAWTMQMNVIYDTIAGRLDDVSRAALARSQAEHMDGISSSSEAARARAYELLEQYRDILQ